MKESLIYGAPLFISLVIASLVSIYAKVFAFDNLSDFDMYQISLNQRITLIIFLMHTSFISYYTKQIYLSKNFETDKKIFLNYFKLIIISVFFVVIILYGFDILVNPYNESIINLSTLYIGIYTIFWVLGAYLEAFLARENKTKQIPIICIVSGGIYLILLLLIKKDILNLSFVMAMYSISYFLISIFLVYNNKKKIFL